MTRYMISARGRDLEDQEYITPEGEKVVVLQGVPGNVFVQEAISPEEAVRLTDIPEGWEVINVTEYIEPDDDDPNAPDTADLLPEDYVVEPFIEGD